MANTFDDTQPKLLIIIPAYNEAENIERVVDNLTENYPQWDYLVVNDGSKDRTAEICREKGYPLLDLPVNLGLAGAFQAGIRYAYQNGYTAALQFDGDGQHEPAYIESMLKKMEQEHLDIVIGSRFCEEKKPHTLRMLGQGTKVCVECAVMALDCGAIQPGPVVCVGGTGAGADTAWILRPAHAQNILDVKLDRLICKVG